MKTKAEIENKVRYLESRILTNPINSMRNEDKIKFIYHGDIREKIIETLKWVLRWNHQSRWKGNEQKKMINKKGMPIYYLNDFYFVRCN